MHKNLLSVPQETHVASYGGSHRLGHQQSEALLVAGQLATWQMRRVADHIEKNLSSKLRNREIAALLHLSEFHFSRAFRLSFGATPHAYLVRRRIERAKELMRLTAVPLGLVALECGLTDQSHFTNLFRRVTGFSPGVWRRLHRQSALEMGTRTAEPSVVAR